MTSATPKPRAGEHTWHDDKMLILALRDENDTLRSHNAELEKVLRALTALCDNVPIFQLDDGKASVKAIRLAGKFTAAHKAAHTILAKEKAA